MKPLQIPCVEEFEKFMSIKPCTTCHGARLKPEVLAITVGDKNINEVTQLTIKEALDFFSKLQLTEREQVIGLKFEGNQCSSWVPQ